MLVSSYIRNKLTPPRAEADIDELMDLVCRRPLREKTDSLPEGKAKDRMHASYFGFDNLGQACKVFTRNWSEEIKEYLMNLDEEKDYDKMVFEVCGYSVWDTSVPAGLTGACKTPGWSDDDLSDEAKKELGIPFIPKGLKKPKRKTMKPNKQMRSLSNLKSRSK